MNKELRKANFKTKKELYNILKDNECYTKRELNIDKDIVDKFFQYANDFEKHIDFFKDIVLKYTKQDEIEEVKSFVDNEEFEYIFRLAKRLYRKIEYISKNDKELVTIENKSQYLVLNSKQYFYKTDFFIQDNKIISKDNLVTYKIFINDFKF
jgi:hypothetical protein